ncbi:MAG: Stp1/IreP family PP2C-type Ser/Thr phosphatase [Acidobacteria bacterium]|nr:Stp1/IreP family PP2C-type Ser/Thr phosphatase [Acidobacteriota bacterium]MCW5967370.1 Stp1/IreP family PP2C-type Ser/Thr phosphatase [Blastocatellales bacterium]
MTDLPNITLKLYAQTDVGMVRSGNEDNFLILDLSTGESWTAGDPTNSNLLDFSQGYYGSLIAVSDGMGGALAGEVASRLAVETVRDRMLQLQAHGRYRQVPFHERLRLAIEEANQLINVESVTNPEHKGLGATFTAAAAQGNRLYFAQVGDSRAYLLRQGKIIRITKDQSLVQQLIDAGQITEEEAETHSYRNVILQALGAHGNVNVEVNSIKLCQTDTLVLCSDGLSGKVRADEIARLVQSTSDLNAACQSLISLANERGGEDNITVVIVQFTGAGLPAPPPEPVEPDGMTRLPDTPTALDWSVDAEEESPPDNGKTTPLDVSVEGGTEPLPPPPSSLYPSAPLNRPRRETSPGAAPQTEQLGEEPITKVIRVEDFQNYLEEEERTTRETAESQGDPLLAAHTVAAQSSSPTGAAQGNTDPTPPNRKSSRFAVFALVIFGVGALALAGAYAFIQYQNTQREIEQERKLREEEESRRTAWLNEIDLRIARLSQRVGDIRAKLGTVVIRNENRKKNLDEEMEEITKAYNELLLDREKHAADLSEKNYNKLNKDSDELEQKISRLEQRIDQTSNLLPHSSDHQYPVTC